MAKVIVGRGRASMTIEGPSANELEDAVRKSLGPALDRVEEEVQRIRDEDIEQRWPVKTGKSRDAWEVVLQLNPDKLSATVALHNDHKYVRYLKSTKHGDEDLATRQRSPLTSEVRKPLREAKKELKGELKPLIERALQEAINGK